MAQLSHLYMTTGKTTALTRRTFVGKVMSPLFKHLQSRHYSSKHFLPFPGRMQQPGVFGRPWRRRQDPLRLPLTQCSALLSPSTPRITRLGLEITSKSESSTSSLIVSPTATLENLLGASNTSRPVLSFFFLLRFLFIYFWLCWVFVAALRLPLVAASGAASVSEHALSSGAQVELLGSTWGLPVCPAVAGGFLTITPPGKSPDLSC